jgi:hypothetical protein
LLSVESDRAAWRTWVDADPVAIAPTLTFVILDATSAVPLAAWPTLCAISWVISPCACTAADMSAAIVEIWPIVALTSLMAPTESVVAALHPGDLCSDFLGCLGGLSRETGLPGIEPC